MPRATLPLTDDTTPMQRADRLRSMRDELIEARAKGVRAVQFGEDRVEYRSDSEMAAALAAVDAELAKIAGRGSRRTFYPSTSKGTM